MYAVGKDVVARVVYVAQGRHHPALLCTTALLRTPHWLSDAHVARLAAEGQLRCQYKARYGQQPQPCTLLALDVPGTGASGGALDHPPSTADLAAAEAVAERLGFRRSAYCRLHPEDSQVLPSYVVVRFDDPAVAITPQQACVLYDRERCLGSALIAQPGRSMHEEGLAAAAAAAAAVR